MTVGFPVRKRIEGLGLEIPFPLLLRFADVSVSMEYDGGTILVGASTILFPSRELEDGVQWHIMDATSTQEAVQVLDQSDGWVRTRDIGRLANMRAYLGFCSQAQVLLGTRDLVISHQITELQSQLPATKRRMEMAHEGTLSAGVSFHGVFNATVGGKWYVPPRLTVSFEETRELDDLLESSCDRPVLIYDHTEDRGWLVPELRLILHMSLAYTSQENVRRRCLATVQDALPWLTASVDKNFDMKNKISSSWNFELYKKVEDGQMKTFGSVFRDFMKDFQKLRTAENLRREGKGFKFSSRTLRGWDFSQLASKAENAFQREMKWRHSSRPMWTALGDTRDMLVILGSNFGNLILLDLQNTKVPSGWESVPKGAGLLTAMCRCVKKLGQTGVLLPTCSESTPKQQSAELFWYRPATFHRDCNEYCNSSCMIIHEIKDPGRWTRTCTDIKDPRSLQEDGAIIFGCASLYHEYLTR